MRSDGFADAGTAARLLAGSLHSVLCNRLSKNVTWKQPVFRAGRTKVASQRFQQFGREHDIAVLLPFALFHPDDHPLAVDIDGLQVNGLGDPQARRVAGGQDGAVLGAAHGAEELQNFLRTQNHGQLFGFLRRRNHVLERPILLERDLIEKA